MKNDELGKRMKEFYEQIPKTRLMRRTPVAVRVDGKAFHTFTRKFKKPFDEIMIKSMQSTMQYLCQNIQGCVFGYTQSDEITLILVDYQTLTTSAFFDYEVQKMCSVIASMATLAFNREFNKEVADYHDIYVEKLCDFSDDIRNNINLKNYDYTEEEKELKEMETYFNNLVEANRKGAMFDCRVFNIPKEEVCNLVYWRQIDAAKNSVQMVGRAYFSHKQLDNKNTSQIQDMLHEQFGVNWNDFPTEQKRGSACIKTEDKGWVIDHEMPILKGDDREYVEKYVLI